MTTADPPVALVTGTSTGIGLHSAVALARHGHHVVATLRDPSRADRLRQAADEASVELDVRALDVTDEDSARGCVEGVLADHGRVDVLVNNAGAGLVGTLEQLTTDDLQRALDVNYLGVARVTRLVLPTMRAAGRGRVVTVSSVGGAVGQPFNDAYCAAKFAVEGLMQSLAPVAERHGVRVVVVEPGAVASEFVTTAAGSVQASLGGDPAYAALLSAYLERTRAAFAAAQDPREVAAVIVRAATDPEPPFRLQTSAAATAFAGLSLADVDGSRVLGQTRTWLG